MAVTKTTELFHQDDVALATRILAVDSAGNPIGGGVGSNVFVTNTAVDPVPTTFPPGTVIGLDATTLAALETINAIITSIPAVALDAATLAALETINAVVTGTVSITGDVSLSVATLAALETINAAQSGAWSVELGSTTLAALETINAVQSGAWSVALDAPTLAALENITATISGTVTIAGTVAVSNFPAVQPVNDNGGSLTVDGTVAVSNMVAQGLTDTQLRATPVPVSGTVTATGPLTDTQLRATPVPVSGTVTANTGLSQPLTDAQLRAVPVPVSGTVTVNQPVTTKELNQLVPFQYDFIDLSYTGSDITTVVYKTGGAGGTTVATLTLAYISPGVLDTVTRT